MNGVYQTLYGYENPNDNQNEEGCKDAYQTKFNEEYPEDVGGLKCPLHSPSRLFRSPDDEPVSLEECEQLCYETQFCDYFSLATKNKHFGVCILCTSDEPLEADSNFVSYQMTSTQTFPTAAPTEEDDRFNVIGQNTKCPYDKTTRLFKKEGKVHTRDECYDLCYNTEGCNYFSLGENTEKYETCMYMLFFLSMVRCPRTGRREIGPTRPRR